jgi:hypothetical protein
MLTLNDVANASRHHVVKVSIPDADGGRPAFGGSEKFQTSRHSREHVLSPEDFHGRNGRGCAASRRAGSGVFGASLGEELVPDAHPTRPGPGEPGAVSPCNPHRTSRGSSCR